MPGLSSRRTPPPPRKKRRRRRSPSPPISFADAADVEEDKDEESELSSHFIHKYDSASHSTRKYKATAAGSLIDDCEEEDEEKESKPAANVICKPLHKVKKSSRYETTGFRKHPVFSRHAARRRRRVFF